MKFAKHIVAASLLSGVVFTANADVITDWNIKAGEIVTESKLGTPPAVRVMAIVQTAVHDAVNSVPPGASTNAAVAAANRVTMTKLMPSAQASIDSAYQAALAQIADGPAKTAGVAAGEQAAAATLARRADDGAVTAESYRPHTTAGMYVPTATPAVTQWSQRKPWVMTNCSTVSARPATGADQRRMGARLQRDQVNRRQEQHAAHRRANRDRALLGILAAGDLSRRRALGRARTRARRGAERAHVRGGRAGDGRCDDQRVRRQVSVQLLASGHRDPQRRHRRQ